MELKQNLSISSSLLLHRWHFRYCKMPEHFYEKHFLTCSYHGLEGAKRSCWSALTMIGREQRKFVDLPSPCLGRGKESYWSALTMFRRGKENLLICPDHGWEGAKEICWSAPTTVGKEQRNWLVCPYDSWEGANLLIKPQRGW